MDYFSKLWTLVQVRFWRPEMTESLDSVFLLTRSFYLYCNKKNKLKSIYLGYMSEPSCDVLI